MTQSEKESGTEHRQAFHHEEEGYQKSLGKRQLQMIAIGGAIGTGLFLGAGGRLASAGPALAIVYAICGFFVFLILRALGELVLHRPSSGSFVSYAREFYGEKAAYIAGWLYWLNWAFTSIVDTTAIALYMKYWGAFEAIPQWVIALVALVVVLGGGGPASLVAFDIARAAVPPTRIGRASGIVNVGGFVSTVAVVLLVGLALDLQGAGTPDAYTLAAFRVAMLVQVPVWLVALVSIARAARRVGAQSAAEGNRGARFSRSAV